MNYEHINRILSWKLVVLINGILCVALLLPLFLTLSQTSTENRSKAAELKPQPTPLSLAHYPANSPMLSRVRYFFGNVTKF